MENAVVIGGSSGIGRHTALALQKRGYNVFNASRTSCSCEGVTDISLDVSRKGEIETVLSGIDGISVLVYSAGFSMAAPIEYTDPKDIRYLFDVNFFGLADTVAYCAKTMRKRGGGRIIAVGSLASLMPIAFDAFYSSSKAAVDMLVRAANIELNPYNVYLTCVRPGATDTRFTFKRKVYPEETVGAYGEKMNKAVVTLANAEQRGMDPSAVADCIVSTLDSKNPPTFVNAGLSNKGLAFIEKIFPCAAVDLINKNFYMQ